MITVLLSGGLGNQMFQYATAKALATRLNVPLAIDLLYYSKKTKATPRLFGLDVFNTDLKIKSDWRNLIYVRYKLFFLKHINLLQMLKIFSDSHALYYEKGFENLKDGTILSGYFQNENYFKSIEAIIRSDFKFKNTLKGRNLELSEKIHSTLSIAIHIRRGDYVTNPVSNLAVCNQEYYHKAIEYITKKIVNPSFFIFSDDMEWVRNNIDFGNYPVIPIDWNNNENSYIDLHLMSLCKHNIIANSSFSWWGAWLNSNSQKIVIAPQQWFKNDLPNKNYSQYTPKKWLRI